MINDLKAYVEWCSKHQGAIDKVDTAKKASDKLKQIYNNLDGSKIDAAKNDIKNLYNDKDVQGYLAKDVKEFLKALCTNK